MDSTISFEIGRWVKLIQLYQLHHSVAACLLQPEHGREVQIKIFVLLFI